MLLLKATIQFKKDLKKFKYSAPILHGLNEVTKKLLLRSEMDPRYSDHRLRGEWKGSRDCHIAPDVVLIYRIDEESELLIFERIGSHSDLF